MGHEHHHHSNPSSTMGTRILWGIGLNVVFASSEYIAGILSHSSALKADATHNFTDVLGLILAWIAIQLVKRKASDQRSFGFKKASILASVISSSLLLFAMADVLWESINKLAHPESVNSVWIIGAALVGVFVNGFTAWLLFQKEDDINIRGAYLHMVSDLLVSVGVVISGVVIWLWGFEWIDSVAGIVVVVLIIKSTWKLLMESIHMILDGVPHRINANEVRSFILKYPGVHDVHDLHIWSLSTTEVAIAVHIEVEDAGYVSFPLQTLQNEIHEKFDIDHFTMQLEIAGADDCLLQCEPQNQGVHHD